MKVIVTGAKGLLGSAISQQCEQRGWACTGLAHGTLWEQTPAQLRMTLQSHDLLIHAAAWTDVEQCEINPDKCYRDNFVMTELLSHAAADVQLPMMFVSSTGIYGSAQTSPYREYDAPQPTTHHHRSKLLGEQAVLGAAPRNSVIRTGWLYGGDFTMPKNFVARRIEEAKSALRDSQMIRSNQQQRGNPSWNRDVACRMLTLAQQGHAGLFNCVNSGHASRFEYVQAIVALSGLDVDVQAASASSFNRRAKVSDNETADNWKMGCLGMSEMPDWRASLAAYIAGLMKH
ncbi:SDR family oxidoreductase [Paraburkholderia lycopersici]|nr:sugar nucleotide-binding protein [Paraburkholderia lycopersici]